MSRAALNQYGELSVSKYISAAFNSKSLTSELDISPFPKTNAGLEPSQLQS